MKLLLIKWLLRLTDIPNAPKPDVKTEDWLAHSYMNDGFGRYLHAREEKLRDYIVQQVNNEPRPTAQQMLAMGQLQELTNLMSLCESAFNAHQTKKKVTNTPANLTAKKQ